MDVQEHANNLTSQAAAAQQSLDFCASFAEDMLNEFAAGLAEVAQDIAECDTGQQGQQQLGSDSLDQGGVVTACMPSSWASSLHLLLLHVLHVCHTQPL